MGILRTLKHAGEKVKSMAKIIGDGLADVQNSVSVISPSQLKDIEDSKKKYYEKYQKDNPSNDEYNASTNDKLGEAAIEIYNAYLSQINELYKPIDNRIEYDNRLFNSNNNIRYINITKWVIDKNENSLEKLVNVYEVLSNEECNIALVFDRKINSTDVYLAIINTKNDNNNDVVDSYTERMLNALKGNFPGSTYTYNRDNHSGRIGFLDKAENKSIACISNIPAEKSDKFNSQTIEKLIDGNQPENKKKEWTLILIATAILDVKTRKLQVGEYYSFFAPYKNWETNYTVIESKTNQRSTAVSFNLGGNSNVATNINGVVNVGIPGTGVSVSTGRSKSHGMNFGGAFTSSMSQSATIGKNEGLSKHFENYIIKHTLELLDEQMKRLEQASALGYWDFAAYVLSEDINVVNNVAHSYLALTQGEKSYMGEVNVNTWRGDVREQINEAKEIVEYLKDFRHPIFALNPEKLVSDESYNMYPTKVTATTQLSGKELAYALNFPKKSVSGLPVIECVEFGRNISTFDEINNDSAKLELGNIFHMHHEEKNVKISLSKKSLASHTFITGSTGSGKSNTVYQLLNEAIKNDVKFMVVEPTKGEYKDVFCSGDNPIAKVYGTNPSKTPLLRINPFSFPKDIHVFEHMDRLVEIFNVCWPMYAAMPTVLKSAIEKAYEDCGWDLIESKNKYNDNYYPYLKDVARNVKLIIESSEYDAENKGAYKGSLLTRLQSLTNGINGLIFTNDEIDLKDLFDENVIIDISRVGSNETKSLIMGMMVLKLQEYRISNHNGMNEGLKHLTVLEEAHNLLKRTSTEQVMESSNLIGKSVEMISNAIAEMRTYGEGFIIVDQSPGLLDMSAIRNTNTKIIMRLPDEMDRKLVGKSANLNDNQIIELAKLPCGVAAIYQNEWIEPVLCKVNRFYNDNEKYTYESKTEKPIELSNDEKLYITEILCNNNYVKNDKTIRDIKDKLDATNIDSYYKVNILDLLENPNYQPRMTKLAIIVNEFFPSITKKIESIVTNTKEKNKWDEIVYDEINSLFNTELNEQIKRDIMQACMTYYYINILNNEEIKLKEWIAFKEGKVQQ